MLVGAYPECTGVGARALGVLWLDHTFITMFAVEGGCPEGPRAIEGGPKAPEDRPKAAEDGPVAAENGPATAKGGTEPT